MATNNRPTNLFKNKFASILICFLISNSLLSAQEVSEEQAIMSLTLRFVIVIIAAVIAFIARGLLLRRLNRLMMSESKRMEDIPNETVHEISAKNKISIIEVNPEDILSGTNTLDNDLETKAKKGVNRLFLTNLIIAVLYVIGYFFVFDGNSFKLEIVNQVYTGNMDIEKARSLITPILTYRFFVILFLVWTILQFISSRYQLLTTNKSLLGILRPISKLIFAPFHSYWSRIIGIIALLHTLFYGLTSLNFFLLISIVIHLVFWYLLKKNGRNRINTKLLILRVFLIGKTSNFTFRRIAGLWKHFGNYFTVADPSFFKVNWKRRFNYTFPFYILVVFFLYTLITDPNKEIEGQLFVGFVFLLIVGNLIMMSFNLIQMKRQFMHSTEALNKRLTALKKQPTNSDNTFKEVPVMCYDNTWKQAVDGLISNTDVVLMDLRGFSEANKGCAYEINVLFDDIDARRIVFLGYKDSVPLIRSVIEEQWEKLSKSSPNLDIENPFAKLYVVNKENHKDVQNVVRLLLQAKPENKI